MKKKIVFLTMLIFLFIFFSLGTVNAKNKNEFVGGITYNTFSLNGSYVEELKNGLGIYGGIKIRQKNYKNIAVEFGLEFTEASANHNNYYHSFGGSYAKVHYYLNENISFNCGTGLYSYYSNFGESNNGSGIGLLLGGKFDYPLQKNLTLRTDLNYRFLKFNSDSFSSNNEINMDGFRIGIGLTYGI